MMAGRINWPGTAVLVTFVLVWQVAAGTGPLNSLESLPTPVEVVGGFADLLESGSLLSDVVYTVYVVVVSSLIAIAAGLTLGLMLGLIPLFDVFFSSTLDVLRTIPLVALMPVALLLWGAEARTEIIVASVAATWPMMVNTAGGIKEVHPRLGEVGRMFQFTRLRTVTRLMIPAAVPQLMVGSRLAIVTALVAAIVAEMIISPTGLGWALIESQNALQTGQMWAVAITCGLLGYLLNIVLTTLVRRLHGGQDMGV